MLAKSAAPAAPAQDAAVQTAREAGLRYVTDERPGIRRIKAGSGFRYVDTDGKTLRDAETLTRIRSLVIPPAWTNVWICPIANGHIQATGLDVRGRKQYRYHPRWRAVRDEDKFGRLIAFATKLPHLRRRVGVDLKRTGLPREKVLAAVVRLLETTYIRVGNERYARENGSFGLTTLRNRHVRVKREHIAFDFRGKSGKQHHIELTDARLASIIRECQDLPGQELFQYVDENGEPRSIDAADVNDYLREVCGEEFTAKDFRTWAGTVLMVLALRESEMPASDAHAKKVVTTAVRAVAYYLGNTVAVCRKSYIHPRVIEAFVEGIGNDAASAYAHPSLAGAVRGCKLEAAVIRLLRAGRKQARKRGKSTPAKEADLSDALQKSIVSSARKVRTASAARL